LQTEGPKLRFFGIRRKRPASSRPPARGANQALDAGNTRSNIQEVATSKEGVAAHDSTEEKRGCRPAWHRRRNPT